MHADLSAKKHLLHAQQHSPHFNSPHPIPVPTPASPGVGEIAHEVHADLSAKLKRHSSSAHQRGNPHEPKASPREGAVKISGAATRAGSGGLVGGDDDDEKENGDDDGE